MNSLSRFFCLSLSTLAFGLTTASASEAPRPSGWHPLTVQYAWTGSAVKAEYRGIYMPAESVYSGDATTTGNVAFTCYNGQFSANVALEAVDMQTLIRNPDDSRRRKNKRQDIKIDGEKIASTDWIYMPKLKVYQARKHSTAAKLYNSVIRKSDVTMRLKGKTYLPLNLPPLDDAFRQFGAECGMGVAAKKT